MNLLYRFLKNYCRAALWFFYKKWQVQYLAPVPEGAVIFVANHQNAFLDAVLVGCSTHRHPWFVARASVFKNSWSNFMLRQLKMLPVYRFRDGFDTLRKNEDAFQQYTALLERGESILIFGEGNHDERWSLRPFQKGFARMAFAAAEKCTVQIVPIGIQFESHANAGSRVLVSFGKAIAVPKPNPEVHIQTQYDQLIQQTHEMVQSLMLHLPAKTYDQDVNLFLKYRVIHADLIQQLRADQSLVQALSSLKGRAITTSSHFIPLWKKAIAIYSSINTFLPKAIIQWILSNTKDPQFTGSLKFSVGMVVVPLFYLLQALVFYLITDSYLWTTLYGISLPISFWVARSVFSRINR
ncbi:MAG: 1-acyl-sn-glycerol-3-phosphate acyltransferase [Cyclobacteriaceae bacterium]|jgi:1-acyl-sn-glycerol-3-phosphate acyltransferase|nr:1-acyl-sn-glycerol-3-phosphate acyltransferase [Flammeovirgaceae bacterium]